MADRKFNIDEVIVNDRSAGEFFFEQKELVVSTVLAAFCSEVSDIPVKS